MNYVIFGAIYDIEIEGIYIYSKRELANNSFMFGVREKLNSYLYIHSNIITNALSTTDKFLKVNSITYVNLDDEYYKHDFKNETLLSVVNNDLVIIEGKKLKISDIHIDG